jgi:hypothetical protein
MDKTESGLSMDGAPTVDQILYSIHLIECELAEVKMKIIQLSLDDIVEEVHE